jgi:hypothetical protein
MSINWSTLWISAQKISQFHFCLSGEHTHWKAKLA